MWDVLAHEVRYTIRRIHHSGWAISVAVAILAVGIGATATIFSAVSAISLRTLSITDPDTLLAISARTPEGQLRPIPVDLVSRLSGPDAPLGELCAYSGGALVSVEVNGVATLANAVSVSGSCFRVFGVKPALGRLIDSGDAPMGQPGQPVAVLGHRFWQRTFASSPSAINDAVKTEGTQPVIIGVAPADFVGLHLDTGVDLFVPVDTVTRSRPGQPAMTTYIVGRLRDGFSIEQSRAWLRARWSGLQADAASVSAQAPTREGVFSPPTVEPIGHGISFLRERFGAAAFLVFSLTTILLLLTCVNLSAFLYVRASERAGELALRVALGASNGRLITELAVEGMMVTALATLLAVPLSDGLAILIEGFLPVGSVDRILSLRPDWVVTAATAGLGLLIALLTIALASWFVSFEGRGLHSRQTRTITSHKNRFLRYALIAQVALSAVLLSTALLLSQTVLEITRQDLGVNPQEIVVIRALPVPSGYSGIDNSTYYPALLDQIREIPGVTSVGFARVFPRMVVDPPMEPVFLLGELQETARAALEVASPGFFETVQMTLIDGRAFGWSDNTASQPVAIISKSLGQMLSSGNQVGTRVSFGANSLHQNLLVVGVVDDATLGDPRRTALPILYRPPLQVGRAANYPNIVIATNRPIGDISASVKQLLAEGGREYAQEVERLVTLFRRASSTEQLSAVLAGILAFLAVSLAFAGLFALLAQSVERRRREIGVRIALGARSHELLWMIARDGLFLVLVGLSVGLPMSFGIAQILQSTLLHVTRIDLTTIALTTAVFMLLGTLVTLIPAQRAARLDAIEALRSE